MAVTRLADVVVPEEFTSYIVENSVVSTAFSQSGVMVANGVMQSQLLAGANSWTQPYWLDLPDVEADIVTDNPADIALPLKLTSGKQIVRKSYLHQSWSSMNLAAELAGSNPLDALKGRVTAYWDRQVQTRLISTLKGVLAANTAQNSGDMVIDLSGQSGTAAQFSAGAVIDAALTLGDRLEDVKGIAMHSKVYGQALKNDLIEFIPQSSGLPIKTFRGLAVVVDDGLTVSNGVYMSVLFGPGSVGYSLTDPRVAPGTELENAPASGNGGGQQTLHSRINLAVHPLGWQWQEGTGANLIVSESPSVAELANAAHWTRVVARKAAPFAFLITK